jgi:hypothetical protein
MPTFENYPANQALKILYFGHSGVGKTGSLCSLVAAGYNLRILDLDNGSLIVRHYLTHPNSIYTKAHPQGLWSAEQASTILKRASYISCTEGYQIYGTQYIPKATIWRRISQILANWSDADHQLGSIEKWGPQDVLVIDGLSRLTESAMNFQLSMRGPAGFQTGPQVGRNAENDYTQAYKLVTNFLDMLKCDEIKCNIIMICHIRPPATEGPQTSAIAEFKSFPQTIGRQLGPMIGQYFNHSLRAKSIGNRPNVRRIIITNNDENIDLKTVVPLAVPQEYSLETGLAEYFRDVKAGLPKPSPVPSPVPAAVAAA